MEYGHDEISLVTIGSWQYNAVRVTDDHGNGYIELREPGSGAQAGRISYRGPDLPMELSTHGVSLPRPVVQWLLDRADEALA